ncbi:hypothetical protein LTR72_000576, partial [Exophiala xenobiotica]
SSSLEFEGSLTFPDNIFPSRYGSGFYLGLMDTLTDYMIAFSMNFTIVPAGTLSSTSSQAATATPSSLSSTSSEAATSALSTSASETITTTISSASPVQSSTSTGDTTNAATTFETFPSSKTSTSSLTSPTSAPSSTGAAASYQPTCADCQEKGISGDPTITATTLRLIIGLVCGTTAAIVAVAGFLLLRRRRRRRQEQGGTKKIVDIPQCTERAHERCSNNNSYRSLPPWSLSEEGTYGVRSPSSWQDSNHHSVTELPAQCRAAELPG